MRKGAACWCAPSPAARPCQLWRAGVPSNLQGESGPVGQRQMGGPVWSPRPGPALMVDPSCLPCSLPGGSTPPTCRARTCIPHGSTTSARSLCPCTGTASAALGHHAPSAFHFPSVLKPHFLMFIIFIDFCFFFSLKFMCFSKWSSVCGLFRC